MVGWGWWHRWLMNVIGNKCWLMDGEWMWAIPPVTWFMGNVFGVTFAESCPPVAHRDRNRPRGVSQIHPCPVALRPDSMCKCAMDRGDLNWGFDDVFFLGYPPNFKPNYIHIDAAQIPFGFWWHEFCWFLSSFGFCDIRIYQDHMQQEERLSRMGILVTWLQPWPLVKAKFGFNFQPVKPVASYSMSILEVDKNCKPNQSHLATLGLFCAIIWDQSHHSFCPILLRPEDLRLCQQPIRHWTCSGRFQDTEIGSAPLGVVEKKWIAERHIK